MKRELYTINTPFVFESGEKIASLDICYHHTANYSPDKKVIWICHALTANSNPQEWWDGLTGPGKLFDTEKFYIICANMIGSCYGSSGPSSPGKDGKPYFLTFPQVTVRDIVRAHNILREHLGIRSIDVMTGGSIGGFQALEWSIMYPDIVKNLVLIACNARVSPWGTAWNESQRMALFADFTFEEQNNIDGGKSGLEAARSIALISYRSFEGYGTTQQEPQTDTLFAKKAGSYQQYQGKKLSDRFDAYSYYTLTKSVDSHNVGRGRGGTVKALGQIEASTIVIGIDSDNLFPVEEQKFLFNNIKNAKFDVITSLFGHDGFLLEWEQTENILKKQINFLN
ncbi:MAG: homoserine O-acetyltransferase [Bacteroidales bacterium]|nr:homoserine O-acetyltransferase [Bacteroidales bacterium]MDD2281011.1 homoserine O-acetyltransferase [Bacteroidales bacterium]MDD4491662.1 homoserine O-acetyltransferase [Bacteroidales bacterium]